MDRERKVFIITEGGDRIGLGHITRCLSLYQAFEAKGILPEFIVNGDESIDVVLKNRQYKRFNWLEHKDRVLTSIKDSGIAIVDSYLADIAFYNEVSDSVRLPVYIDDNKRLDYPKGVVVNGSISAEMLNYPARENINYLLGPKYIPLRKEFWNVSEKIIREKVERIMITFGGDDTENVTPSALRMLAKRYPQAAKNVIVGRGFRNEVEIKKAADARTELIYSVGAEGMKSVMFESDIALSAGGQTLYELARVGMPAIAVIVADNQLNNVQGWEKNGFVVNAGWHNAPELPEKINEGLKLLEERMVRERMSKAGKLLVDGGGAERAVETLMSIL